MADIVVVNFVTLDGVVQSVLSADEDREGGFEAGGWVQPYMDEVVGRAMGEATTGAAALLLGRKTYQKFAETWATADRSEPAVAALNSMPKYVASTTLTRADWQNSHVLGDDVIAEVGKLKERAGGDIVVFGSSRLIPALAAAATDCWRWSPRTPIVWPTASSWRSSMAEPKTTASSASAAEFLDAVTDPRRRTDAIAACDLIAEVTGAAPVMWGDSIVGFGAYHYRYASGRAGDWPAVGLSPRKTALVLYLSTGFDSAQALLDRLGPHKIGKACLYLKRLDDVDPDVLRELVGNAFRTVDGTTITSS